MLHVAADFLTRELNAYLLTRIATDAGKWAIPDDQVGVALVNVEEERALRSQVPQTVRAEGRHVTLEPELKLNLHLLFAAHFKNYDQGRPGVALVDTNIRQIALSN